MFLFLLEDRVRKSTDHCQHGKMVRTHNQHTTVEQPVKLVKSQKELNTITLFIFYNPLKAFFRCMPNGEGFILIVLGAHCLQKSEDKSCVYDLILKKQNYMQL